MFRAGITRRWTVVVAVTMALLLLIPQPAAASFPPLKSLDVSLSNNTPGATATYSIEFALDGHVLGTRLFAEFPFGTDISGVTKDAVAVIYEASQESHEIGSVIVDGSANTVEVNLANDVWTTGVYVLVIDGVVNPSDVGGHVLYLTTSYNTRRGSNTYQIQYPVGSINVTASPVQVEAASTVTISGFVKNTNNEAVQGKTVKFSTNRGVEPAPVITQANGSYSTTFTVPEEAGEVTLTAKVDGTAISDSTTIDVVAGPVSRITIIADKETITAGQTVTLSGQVTDTFDNPIQGAVVSYSGSEGEVPGATAPTGADGKFSSTFTPTKAAIHTVTATVVGPNVTAPVQITVEPDVPNSLTASGPGQVAAGSVVDITGVVKDRFGNAVPDASIVFAASNGDEVNPATTQGDGTYTASFVPTQAGAMTVTATVQGTAIDDAVALTVTPAAANKLVFSIQPVDTTAGSAFGVQVKVLDQYDNLVTDAIHATELQVTDGRATLHGITTVNAVNGIADFTDLVINAAGNYTLTASAAGLTSATSDSFSVNPGAAHSVVVSVNDAEPQAGSTVTISGKVADAKGNGVPGVNVQFSSDSGPAPAQVISEGDGTYTASFVPTQAGAMTVTATVEGTGISASTAVTVTPAAADKLAFSIQPVDTTAGRVFSVQVKVLDQYDNLVADATHATVLEVTGDVVALHGTTTVNAVNGIADFTDLVIKEPGDYTLTASTSGVTGATSDQFTITRSVPPRPPVLESNIGAEILVNGDTVLAGTATTAEVDGQLVTTVAIDEEKLQQRLAAEGDRTIVTIPFAPDSDVVVGELSGRMVKEMESKEAVLELRSEQATYTLPAEQINIEALSEQFGPDVQLVDIKVNIEIANPPATTIQLVENAANKNGLTLVVPPVNFRISASHEGSIREVTTFTAYVERTIVIPADVDPSRITTAVVIDLDGIVHHVPTEVVTINGVHYARINSLTNSIYTVIWNPVEFTDVSSHWAQAAVNNMGSRLVVNGTGNGMFSPERAITRAEFAAIMTRALGLRPEEGQGVFADVAESDWFNGAVYMAYKYELLQGYEDGTFRPHEPITREQAMVIIANAMKTTGLGQHLPEMVPEAVLHAYRDYAELSSWSMAAVAHTVQAGIVTGRSDSELAPGASITRAEVAAIAERLLRLSGLIN